MLLIVPLALLLLVTFFAFRRRVIDVAYQKDVTLSLFFDIPKGQPGHARFFITIHTCCLIVAVQEWLTCLWRNALLG